MVDAQTSALKPSTLGARLYVAAILASAVAWAVFDGSSGALHSVNAAARLAWYGGKALGHNIHYFPSFLTAEEVSVLINALPAESDWNITEKAYAEYGPQEFAPERLAQKKETYLELGPATESVMKKVMDTFGVDPSGITGFFAARYKPGHVGVRPHHDCYPEDSGVPTASLLLYLNDLPESAGGETTFPLVNISVRPKAGAALTWLNVDEQHQVAATATHATTSISDDAPHDRIILQLTLNAFTTQQKEPTCPPGKVDATLAPFRSPLGRSWLAGKTMFGCDRLAGDCDSNRFNRCPDGTVLCDQWQYEYDYVYNPDTDTWEVTPCCQSPAATDSSICAECCYMEGGLQGFHACDALVDPTPYVGNPGPPYHGTWSCPAHATNDPHLGLAHGGRTDVRGEDGRVYNMLSHRNVSMSVMFEEADFRWSKRLVHGTKIASAYWTLRDNDNKTVTVAVTALNKTSMHASHGYVAAVNVSGASPASVIVSDAKPYIAAGVSVTVVGRKLIVSAGGWKMSTTHSSFPFASLNKGKVLLDVALEPLYDVEKDPVAPHGLIGQSWDGDDADFDGALDTDRSAETTTKAQGEGAIEGVLAEYEVPSAFATGFKYSRFGISTPMPPRDVSKLTGRKIAKGSRHTASAGSAPADMVETPKAAKTA